MEKSPYDYDNTELVGAFRSAAQEAGAANKERFAYVEFRTSNYFAGVVLARLEGLKPPFNEGDEVQPRLGTKLKRGPWWTIERVLYHGNGIWDIIFRDRCDRAYRPEDFEKIPAKACAMTT